jgi:hypothetical protein
VFSEEEEQQATATNIKAKLQGQRRRSGSTASQSKIVAFRRYYASKFQCHAQGIGFECGDQETKEQETRKCNSGRF